MTSEGNRLIRELLEKERSHTDDELYRAEMSQRHLKFGTSATIQQQLSSEIARLESRKTLISATMREV